MHKEKQELKKYLAFYPKKQNKKIISTCCFKAGRRSYAFSFKDFFLWLAAWHQASLRKGRGVCLSRPAISCSKCRNGVLMKSLKQKDWALHLSSCMLPADWVWCSMKSGAQKCIAYTLSLYSECKQWRRQLYLWPWEAGVHIMLELEGRG